MNPFDVEFAEITITPDQIATLRANTRQGCTKCNTPLLYQDEIDRGLCPSCHVKRYQFRVIEPALFAGTYTTEQDFIDAVRTPMNYANPDGITHTHVIDNLHIHTYSNGYTEMALKFYYERAK